MLELLPERLYIPLCLLRLRRQKRSACGARRVEWGRPRGRCNRGGGGEAAGGGSGPAPLCCIEPDRVRVLEGTRGVGDGPAPLAAARCAPPPARVTWRPCAPPAAPRPGLSPPPAAHSCAPGATRRPCAPPARTTIAPVPIRRRAAAQLRVGWGLGAGRQGLGPEPCGAPGWLASCSVRALGAEYGGRARPRGPPRPVAPAPHRAPRRP